MCYRLSIRPVCHRPKSKRELIMLYRRKGNLFVEGNIIKVEIKEPIQLYAVISFLLLFLLPIGFSLYSMISENINVFFHYASSFLLPILFCPFLYIIFQIGRKEISKLDFVNNKFERVKFFYGIPIRIFKENLDEQFELSYKRDARFGYIWLTVISENERKDKKLIRFFDDELFLNFRKIANEYFPNHKIAY